MPLTADQLTVVRSWVGDVVTDDVLHERYDRLGTLDETVLEELRHQHSVLVDRPANASLPSGLSVGWQQNLQSAEKRLKDFMAAGSLDDDEPQKGAVIAKLVRKDRR